MSTVLACRADLTILSRALLVSLICLIAGPVLAGQVVGGVVRDAQTGEGLPAATIQVDGTYRGTIANDTGEYALELEQWPAVLHITHIGYHSRQVVVKDSTESQVHVEMTVSPHRLPEIVVYPAFGADLIRQVIEAKAEWAPRIESYRAAAYTRRSIERTDEIVEINEIVSDVFWDAELGTREVVTSVRNTANANENQYVSAMEGTVNLYHDDIEFIESDLMGITHPDALDHYQFDLIGRRFVDDTVVFDLSVKPKSRLHSGFEGTVAILDDEFALLEVDLVPTRSTLATAIPIPLIEGLTWRYRQQFRGFDGLWLPVDYRLSVGIKIGMIGFHLPLIGMEQVTRFGDYEINSAQAQADTLFATEEAVHLDSVAIAEDTAFTRFADPVPMTEAEQVALDTITAKFKGTLVFQPTGFLVRFMDMGEPEDDSEDGDSQARGEEEDTGTGVPTQSTHTPKQWWKMADLSPSGRFNRVEEALLALGAQRHGPWEVDLRGRVGFSSGLEKLSFDIGARRQWADEDGRQVYVDAGYRRGGGSHYTSDAYPVFLNTIQALVGEDDYFDYYWSDGFGVDLGVT
ncbi:MAG: carboxypeptidase-like regulatory domain-containing protein, partial [Gemmatimonadetes bacterium]|nr:carboxypeptidase-like regulatory domain-containing protein [Gemmatimonadota bacterium]